MSNLNPLITYLLSLIQNMDASSAATIVRYGLGDRDPKVKEACKMLVLKWLADYNNDVPKFLRLMDFEMYEEEAESLGSTVMEMVERGVAVSQDLSIAVRQHSPDWEQPVSKMVASEILWVHIRCAYAQKNMSPVALADFVDALVPDMIRLCSLLQEARKPALYSSTKYQMIVRYLLRMTAFLDTSDVCGCKELVKVCQEMVSDTNLPEMLVDPMLNAWLISSSFESSERSIQAAVKLSQTVANPVTPPKSTVRMTSDCPLPGDSDDEDDEEAVERVRILSIIRYHTMLCYTVLYCILCAKRLLAAAGWHSSSADLGSRFYTECKIKSTHDRLLSKCLGLLLIRISALLHQMSLLRPITATVQYEFCSPTLIPVPYGGIKATLYRVLHPLSLLTTHHIDVAILGRCKSCHGHCS